EDGIRDRNVTGVQTCALPISDLRKATVSELLSRGVDSERAGRMLEIRRQTGKTSTKKYDAMRAAACNDGRVRGLLQYYGASRTRSEERRVGKGAGGSGAWRQ